MYPVLTGFFHPIPSYRASRNRCGCSCSGGLRLPLDLIDHVDGARNLGELCHQYFRMNLRALHLDSPDYCLFKRLSYSSELLRSYL